MPLSQGKSKKAFSQNVKTEMESGKPQKQALAIAYATKRRNRKKMAKGGPVNGETDGTGEEHPDLSASEIMKDRHIDESADIHGDEEMLHTSPDENEPQEAAANLSHGEGHKGMEPEDSIPDESVMESASLIDAILDERHRKKMAKGGQVLEAGSHEDVFEPEDDFDGVHHEADINENDDESLVGQILKDRKKKS